MRSRNAEVKLSQVLSPPESAGATLRPLCVDLDGTLIKSDSLIDSVLVLARRHPALLFGLLAHLARGKAAFKAYVTSHVTLDVNHLPYNRKVLEFLRQEHQRGRPVYLATGANEALARRVAAHLGLFTDVLGSSGTTNLTGTRKLDRLRERLGPGPFDYIGNDTPDLPMLAQAVEPMVADPSLSLRLRMRVGSLHPVRTFDERAHPLYAVLKAMRLHQWAKNLLMFLPLLLAHSIHVKNLMDGLLAFGCFSLTASATYIVNDLLDIEADRSHPRKRLRPIPSGNLSAAAGLGVVAAFLLLGFAGARLLPPRFLVWLCVYLVSTLAYSLYFKRVALVDVLVLSGLYTLRIQAGGAATGTPISNWMAGFSIFIFLALALVKRFAELENLRASGAQPRNGRGYLVSDIEQVRAFGTASSYAAVVIFAIYINNKEVMALYHHPARLWLVVPLQILWLSRMWLLASRGELNEDPVVFALTDRNSLLIGAAVVVVAMLAV
jgi:4-hydroxybenzoate polyprenyltransferase/phosphoserine phosphatase